MIMFYYKCRQGENFLGGLTPDLYKVTVGEEKCEDVTVTDNSISCLPPRTEPSELQPRVKVGTSVWNSKGSMSSIMTIHSESNIGFLFSDTKGNEKKSECEL